jgi:hypothetical protein
MLHITTATAMPRLYSSCLDVMTVTKLNVTVGVCERYLCVHFSTTTIHT